MSGPYGDFHPEFDSKREMIWVGGGAYGKRMKYSVKPQLLCVLKIDEIIYEILKKNPFAQGVNSDGNDRKPKLKVQKDMINALTIYSQQIL